MEINTQEVAANSEATETESRFPTEAELQANPALKPDVPVEDVDGLDEETAKLLGLIKDPEQEAQIKELEEFDVALALDAATHNLVESVRNAVFKGKELSHTTNRVYGKFITLGMKGEAEHLASLNTNVHFNLMMEALETARAHAILLQVDLGEFV